MVDSNILPWIRDSVSATPLFHCRCGSGPNSGKGSTPLHSPAAQLTVRLGRHRHAQLFCHNRRQHAAFRPIAALQQPCSSPAGQPWRHDLLQPPHRQPLAPQPQASAAPIDYAPSPTDAEVLKLPIKQELKPEQMVNVFGYPRDLRRR